MSKSKNVFITGCNRGIGLELTKQILERIKPQNLIVTCRDLDGAKELSALAKKNANLHILQFDIRKTEKYGETVAQVAKITGEDGLNLLINNAGIQTHPPIMSIYNLTKEDLNTHFEVNTLAPILLIKAFLPLLEKASASSSAPGGIAKSTIMNISTLLSSIKLNEINPNLNGGMYAYRSSKTALNMLTKNLSLELKSKGIVTVIMHPGWVKTDLGGENAPLTVLQSASGITNVLEKITDADNGRFLQFDGAELPW